jgi:CII-binding regulator of phage lambda lysogenization HflD
LKQRYTIWLAHPSLKINVHHEQASALESTQERERIALHEQGIAEQENLSLQRELGHLRDTLNEMELVYSKKADNAHNMHVVALEKQLSESQEQCQKLGDTVQEMTAQLEQLKLDKSQVDTRVELAQEDNQLLLNRISEWASHRYWHTISKTIA